MVRHTKRRNTLRKGGAATAFPLSYFNGKAPTVAADAGRNLLMAEEMGVRPKIGGKRSRRSKYSRRAKKLGGFVPSVMGNFMTSASKYIVPMALFAGYKMIKNGPKSKKSQKKRRTRRR